MDTIESLIEEFCAGLLHIDCSGITEDEADCIDEVLTKHTNIQINDEDFIRNDGSANYSGYIRFYVEDYRYLGVINNEYDHKTLCMWSAYKDNKRHITFREFLQSANVKDVEIEGFDDLFE